MLLFRSEEHVSSWLESKGRSRGAVFSVRQLSDLASVWYAGRPDPDWKRRTAAESEAMLASFGLTGDFWKLT